jgi:glycerophosphoryl diester phosphodiesterase
MQAQRVRYAAYDGRISDLDRSTQSPDIFIPLISERWQNEFSWTGEGPMPEHEQAKLRELTRRARRYGQRLRFWATPDAPGPRELVWQQLRASGVDYINSDDLSGLQRWLLTHSLMQTQDASTPEVDWFPSHDALFEWLPALRTGL